ncbi:hypothetical protein A5893_05285 [Pedobacter psychrophilus]|uniref:Outer membrane protein beta-barrel domain-containing protein n=1 Tax=Pedobacter psychrophilus TaxID=1826909 RepID=A0A179DH25_9SPHI|nr:hypothetical protein [Pedobacter psychrophilus]OAQ40365.1 hypothetical protein A5893_05285 [Pedobacter psychrophilus]
MKKIILTLLLFGAIKAYSQANFSRIAVGLSGGYTSSFTGLTYGAGGPIPGFEPKKTFFINKSKVLGGSLDYYFTPFILGGLEYNSVELTGGTDKHNRAYISKFSSIEIRGNVAVGQFIDFSYSPFLYAIRNVNASLGLGFISGTNNVGDYNPALAKTDPPFPRRQHPNDLGKSEFSGVVSIPATIGYNLNIYDAYQETRLVIGFNYKMNFTLTDDLDGYADDPTIFDNKNNDVYTSLGVSVKFLFGPKGLFYK